MLINELATLKHALKAQDVDKNNNFRLMEMFTSSNNI